MTTNQGYRVVRIHPTPEGEAGTRWWAEDDFGFTGGADTLAEMKAAIIDALCELDGVPRDQIMMTLVDNAAVPEPDDAYGWEWEPDRLPSGGDGAVVVQSEAVPA